MHKHQTQLSLFNAPVPIETLVPGTKFTWPKTGQLEYIVRECFPDDGETKAVECIRYTRILFLKRETMVIPK